MYIPGTTCFAHSSCTSLFILIFIKSTVDCIAHFILFNCTFYFYLILSFFIFFILLLPIFIYILLCYVSFFCTVHWADLSWPTFHYWLYPVWLCMWQIIKNLEPLKLHACNMLYESHLRTCLFQNCAGAAKHRLAHLTHLIQLVSSLVETWSGSEKVKRFEWKCDACQICVTFSSGSS